MLAQRVVFALALTTILPPWSSLALAAPSAEAKATLQQAGVEGGVILHLGCGDGQLTAALVEDGPYLIEAFVDDRADLAAVRSLMRDRGLHRRVSVHVLSETTLPMIDNLVDLVLVETDRVPPAIEIDRVLQPGGVLLERREDGWTCREKAWPEDIDTWTHYLHGPDNNAVAHDRLAGSPGGVQWIADPKWARHHNYLSAFSAMVSDGGRVFSILDEGSVASITLPPKWRLVARDAFNGVVLWKKPIRRWEGHLRPFRSGPTELSRRLVAVDGLVFVTLGYGEPVVALDAATGTTIQHYEDTTEALEFVVDRGVLLVVAGQRDAEAVAAASRRGTPSPPPSEKKLIAVDVDSGRVLWTNQNADTRGILPSTLCVDRDRVFYHSVRGVTCVDRETGALDWRVDRATRTERLSWSTPTLLVVDGVVLSADCASPDVPSDELPGEVQWTVTSRPKRGNDSAGTLVAFDAESGAARWMCNTAQGYNAPPDVFVADGLVWTSAVPNIASEDFVEGRDLKTGEVRRRIETADAFTTTHHHRCYRNKATDELIFLGRTGVELIDLKGQGTLRHNWVRGACQYGVMPCNGLLYAPPHSCACYIQSKISGMFALAPRPSSPPSEPLENSRLIRGPAFSEVKSLAAGKPSATEDWPTYRHDGARSGHTESPVPDRPVVHWKTQLGGPLSSPVVAGDALVVAAVEDRMVVCLDAGEGTQRWAFETTGRVDSPPTIHGGRAVFGCADGWVYCLRLRDGALVWRFRAAPHERRTVVRGQVESIWPVTGSVLVVDGVVYCTAGRSSYLDGGMRLHRLELHTGELIATTVLDSRDPGTGTQPEHLVDDVEMPGALPDVLACDGENLYLRDRRLSLDGQDRPHDVSHLYSSVGFLDDQWWHRTYWIFGTRTYGRASGWSVVANHVPSGRIMTVDRETTFGYGRQRVTYGDAGLRDVRLQLFRADQETVPLGDGKPVKNNNVALARTFVPTKTRYHWSREVPILVRAMVSTPQTLLVAGPEQSSSKAPERSFDDGGPARLMAVDADGGEDRWAVDLEAQPVFDGMILASEQIYISLADGSVVALGERPSP